MIYKSMNHIKHPLISVLILTYNHEKMIETAINSIIKQKTIFSVEIVIVNDCSTDNTKNKCLDYFEKFSERITLIINEKNKGLMRNFHESTIAYTEGKYIAVCAGDDWWIDENKLQKQVEFLEKNPEYALVYTKTRIYSQKKASYIKRTFGFGSTEFQNLIFRNAIPALTACFSKGAFLEYVKEVDPVNHFFIEDYPMWIWFSYRKKIYFLDEITTAYRIHEKSITQIILSDRMKKYENEKQNRDMKLYLCKVLNIRDNDLLNKIDMDFYVSTMYLSSLLNDSVLRDERERVFLEQKLRVFFIFSKIYAFCGSNIIMNTIIHFVEKCLRKVTKFIRPLYKNMVKKVYKSTEK